MNPYINLKEKILNESATIAIIGLGYVGLNLLLNFNKKKFKLIGIDNDLKKIKKLNNGISPIHYLDSKKIKKSKQLTKYTGDFSNLTNSDVIIVCLPTPLKKNNTPDISHLKNASILIKKYKPKGKLIILESTSYPGTTEEIFFPILNETQNIIKNSTFLGFSPERENPGDKKNKFEKIPKVISGINKESTNLVNILYKKITKKTVIAKNIKIAESSKLLENIFRSVNIGMINEMKYALKKMNIDVHEVIKIAKTKPFGFMPFEPGPGVGGHCIPIDPLYFSWKTKKHGFNSKFISLATKTNIGVTKRISKNICTLIKKTKKNNQKAIILGLSYKKNIEDTRESASLKILQHLKNNKINVDYYDPYVKSEFFLKNGKKIKVNAIKFNYKILKKYNYTILISDHDVFKYNLIYQNSNLIIDLRNRFKESEKVIKI
jgi:UDP-N-acetyl-D-glucosamine dehydrogenase